MDVRRNIQARSRIYTVVDDLTTLYRALIIGVVQDEVTESSPRLGFTVRVDQAGLHVKLLESGLFCIAGYVEQTFPNLNSRDYPVELAIVAPGYREAYLLFSIPQNAVFPIHMSSAIKLRPLADFRL